jgi:hypothetical protein
MTSKSRRGHQLMFIACGRFPWEAPTDILLDLFTENLLITLLSTSYIIVSGILLSVLSLTLAVRAST